MANFTFPHFGELDLSNLEEYYEEISDLDGTEIKIDINFNQTSIDIDKAALIKNFISNIHNYNLQNKTLIEKEYNNEDDDTVKEYIEFHLEELDKDELSKFVNFEDKNSSQEKQLLKQIKLARVGLYPDGKYETTYFAVFDYTIDKEITDQLLVIKTDENNTLDHIAWES